MSNGCGADRVFKYKVPADDPRDQLSERSVCVSVGGTCNRHHRGEFRIAQRGKDTGESRDHVRQYQRRPCGIMGGDSGGHKDAGPYRGSDAEARKLDWSEHAAQPIFSVHFRKQDLEWFLLEQLTWHGDNTSWSTPN